MKRKRKNRSRRPSVAVWKRGEGGGGGGERRDRNKKTFGKQSHFCYDGLLRPFSSEVKKVWIGTTSECRRLFSRKRKGYFVFDRGGWRESAHVRKKPPEAGRRTRCKVSRGLLRGRQREAYSWDKLAFPFCEPNCAAEMGQGEDCRVVIEFALLYFYAFVAGKKDKVVSVRDKEKDTPHCLSVYSTFVQKLASKKITASSARQCCSGQRRSTTCRRR